MDDQALPRNRHALRRAVGLAALASTLASLGCTKSPLGWALDFAPPLTVAGKAAPGVASAAPAASPTASPLPSVGATTTPASQTPASPVASAAAGAAEPTEAIDPDDPLPPASTTSDLAPAEQAAVEQTLASADLEGYAGLIHDGGVVLLTHDGGVALFRTLALDDVKRQAATTPGPAPLWGRVEEAHSPPILTLRKQCPDPGDCVAGARPVAARIHFQQKGEFQYKGAVGKESKRYGALFSRDMLLMPRADGGYALAAVGPLTAVTRGGRAGLEVRGVSVFRQGTFTPVGEPYRALTPIGRPVPIADLPRPFGGERVRLEVDLEDGPGAPFVFANLQGAKAAERVQFFDDGRGVDRKAGDRRYSGEVVMRNAPGVQHVLLDVVDPASFTPRERALRAYTVGVGFDVQVKEGR